MNGYRRNEVQRHTGVTGRTIALVLGVGLAVVVCGVHAAEVAEIDAPAPQPQPQAQVCCNQVTNVCTDLSPLIVCPFGCQCPRGWCLGIQACNLPGGSCIEVDARCCPGLGGTAGGVGSVCVNEEACCFFNGSCQDLSASACFNAGGLSRGPGTDCSDPVGTCGLRACCVPVAHETTGCANHTYVACIQDGGTDAGFGPGVICESLDDDDNDEVRDPCDNCDQYNPDQEDDDADGIPDGCDNCSPSNPAHSCAGTGCFNPSQTDCDVDDIGDICDLDFSDCDSDGLDDCCDEDSDGDGVDDVDDVCPFNDPSNTVDANGRPLGDFDGDCFVGLEDFLTFSNNYFISGCPDTSGNCVP